VARLLRNGIPVSLTPAAVGLAPSLLLSL
jgi:hypothetical protein